MQLLPLVVLFIISILILIAIFILVSFLYFRIKHKKNTLNQQFSPTDSVNDPYIEMTPLDSLIETDRIAKQPMIRQPQRNLNMSRMRTSKMNSFSISIPTIYNKTLQTTALLEDMVESDEKFSYISKLVNYTKEGIKLYTYQVTTITSTRAFKNLNWEYDFKIYPIVDHMMCKKNQEGFGDLLDVFKLEVNQFRAVKFVIEVMIKNCVEDRTYYVYDLTKVQKAQTITEDEFNQLKEKLGKRQ